MSADPAPLPRRARQRRLLACGMLAAAAAAAWLRPGASFAQSATPDSRALREMQIHKVPELGLEIWVENQPAWETHLSNTTGHFSFVAQSPDHHHPPAVMTYASWPRERVSPDMMQSMATAAIRRASRNFGLNVAQGRGIMPGPAAYGVLQGFEATFTGTVQGVPMDIKIFVGQAAGRFPVALSLYTLQGKMTHLGEHIRRGWGRLKYLAA